MGDIWKEDGIKVLRGRMDRGSLQTPHGTVHCLEDSFVLLLFVSQLSCQYLKIKSFTESSNRRIIWHHYTHALHCTQPPVWCQKHYTQASLLRAPSALLGALPKGLRVETPLHTAFDYTPEAPVNLKYLLSIRRQITHSKHPD